MDANYDSLIRLYQNAYEAAADSHAGVKRFKNQIPQEILRKTTAAASGANRFSGNWKPGTSMITKVWYYAGLWIGCPALVYLLWKEMEDVRPQWRDNIVGLFRLPGGATTQDILMEILDCVFIRFAQLLQFIFIDTPCFCWGIICTIFGFIKSGFIKTKNALATRFDIWYRRQPISHELILLRYKVQSVWIAVTRHPVYTLLAMVVCINAYFFLRVLIPADIFVGWEPWLSDFLRADETIPDDVVLVKRPVVTTSTQHRQSAWRDVPTAQIVGIDVPISIPAPTMGMMRPEQSSRPSSRTVIAGKKNVYCSKCKQWHCCELPY